MCLRQARPQNRPRAPTGAVVAHCRAPSYGTGGASSGRPSGERRAQGGGPASAASPASRAAAARPRRPPPRRRRRRRRIRNTRHEAGETRGSERQGLLLPAVTGTIFYSIEQQQQSVDLNQRQAHQQLWLCRRDAYASHGSDSRDAVCTLSYRIRPTAQQRRKCLVLP
jgi:hypothetical protein